MKSEWIFFARAEDLVDGINDLLYKTNEPDAIRQGLRARDVKGGVKGPHGGENKGKHFFSFLGFDFFSESKGAEA
jgi:hypothetical protein